jgi:hypothetical protein
MFTGRRPIDEICKDCVNFHKFVKMAIPGRLMQIVDPALLANVEVTAPASTENEVSYISGYNNEVEADEENIDYENPNKMENMCGSAYFQSLRSDLHARTNHRRIECVWRMSTGSCTIYKMLILVFEIRREKPRRS